MTPLLLDQNLSPRLVDRLQHLYPGSRHVSTQGLGRAFDRDVWEYAHEHGYTIVTKDADFGELGTLLGFPPKVIWIRRGNCTTQDIEEILRSNYEAIVALGVEPAVGILVLL